MIDKLQEQINSLKLFYKKNKRIPSYSELQKLWNLASKNSIHKIIHKLIKAGFLQQDTKHKLTPTSLLTALNLLGQIPAGFPIPPSNEQHDLFSLDDYLVEHPNSTFILKVSGDSLKDIGILPNDLVLIDKSQTAKTGDVVLAQVDENWTLKILEKTNNQIKLIPANKAYQPIIPKNELNIYGVVKSLIRKY